MISTDYQLETKLESSKALQLVLQETLKGELVGFEYDATTGIATARTRQAPAFNEEFLESDLSAEVSKLADEYTIALGALDDRKTRLDSRAENLRIAERQLADDQTDLQKEQRKLKRQRERFEKDLQQAAREGLMARVKSFFHRIQ